jgi:hypothetical protein
LSIQQQELTDDHISCEIIDLTKPLACQETLALLMNKKKGQTKKQQHCHEFVSSADREREEKEGKLG